MRGNWSYHMVRGDFRLCMDQSAQAMELAERFNDPGIWMEALWQPAATLLFRADFAGARQFFERALNNYEDRERCRYWLRYTGEDTGVCLRALYSTTLWHLGYPDQAFKAGRGARELARHVRSPFSLGFALYNVNWVLQLSRLGVEGLAAAEEQIKLATEQGFAWWLTTAIMSRGAALLLQGRLDEALQDLQKGLEAYRATGSGMALPYYHSILGDAYTQAGRFGDALCALDEGLVLAEKNDDRSSEAELHRLKGELLLAKSNDQASAKDCFIMAVETSRRQQSKSWELRAKMSLARLWQRQGRSDEARAALAAVYGTYTEGFTTPDLVDAKALLDSMA